MELLIRDQSWSGKTNLYWSQNLSVAQLQPQLKCHQSQKITELFQPYIRLAIIQFLSLTTFSCGLLLKIPRSARRRKQTFCMPVLKYNFTMRSCCSIQSINIDLLWLLLGLIGRGVHWALVYILDVFGLWQFINLIHAWRLCVDALKIVQIPA